MFIPITEVVFTREDGDTETKVVTRKTFLDSSRIISFSENTSYGGSIGRLREKAKSSIELNVVQTVLNTNGESSKISTVDRVMRLYCVESVDEIKNIIWYYLKGQ